MNNPRTTAVHTLLASRGSLTASEIRLLLEASQPTISRAIRASRDILRIGESRSARYALRHPLPDGGSRWSLYRINPDGQATRIGILHALQLGEFHFESELPPGDSGFLLNGAPHRSLFSGLPWFLQDMRPQGYLGRLLARSQSNALGADPNPDNWSDRESLAALLEFGSDTPGCFVLGDKAIEEAQYGKNRLVFHDQDDRAAQYDRIARHIAEDDTALNSSAGGEQPKFATCVRRPSGEYVHVIVKFSGSKQSDVGRRWADLLRAEALASVVLSQNGLPAAPSSILETDERTYLEVERFDRAARFGRIGALSLRSIVAGLGLPLERPWTASAPSLVNDGWLDPSDAHLVAQLECFGHLIGNNDMHPGNLSLFLSPKLPLRLCPSYDMLPMRYAPTRTGDLPNQPLAPRLPRPEDIPLWRQAAAAALQFWSELHDTLPPSSTLLPIARANLQNLSSAQSTL